ncbi:response regulator [Deinococcus apachensis]|uniref:response regulator n=1 Tax=Deinococcus apachensis TaxID=309886 RepID=UPI00036A1E80|nr:response regulator [Deinococcus apachensis]
MTPGAAGNPQRILVIEDSLADALLLELALQEVAPDVQVDIVHDGEAALPAFQAPPTPDLVLLDLHLPRVDSLELLAHLRAQAGPRVRLVLWSSLAQPREVETAYASGATAYVEKPVGQDDLRRLAEKLLSL